MTRSVGTCSPDDSLARAVAVMWDKDCGAVPVVSNGKPVGIVTDRDVAVALTTRNAAASDVPVADVIGGKLVTCVDSDSVTKALKMMGKYRIRRVPVTDKKGCIAGMISISDILNASGKRKSLRKRVLKTLLKISRPHPIVLFETGG